MPLSWNEIRQNAVRFARDWAEESREEAEAKSFWDAFFAVFGLQRRLVATFEEPVRKLNGQYGYIDLFWPGVMLAEHKSGGKSLDKAESQAFRYIQDMGRERGFEELPRYVILSDFRRIALYDLEPDPQLDLPLFESRQYYKIEFPLKELPKRLHEFAFIAGYKQHRVTEEAPINIKAVEILGNLHDALAEGGYKGHDLERFLVRILFCLFAEDTGLFEPDTFKLYLANATRGDGSDLGIHLARLFEVLDTPREDRQKNLDELLAAFPYVNGALFRERLKFADFNRAMRDALVACTAFSWSKISPAVFGSLFQGVMDAKERRQVGGHYTSERDILKVINPLFLDGLRAEFERCGQSKNQLRQFQEKLGRLRFFDPACGCGNFLVITYRELRLLEIEVLKTIYDLDKPGAVFQELDVLGLSKLRMDVYHGIEIQEWPARIAEVAMWLMDHQMNMRLAEAFGQYFVRLPLKESAKIHVGNALRLDWKDVLPPDQCSYVLGNPPFIGKKEQDSEQKADMDMVWKGVAGSGVLDYVTAWYRRAAEYIQGTAVKVAFVSTNSISQGEQVSVLWGTLLSQYRIKIHFAHRTFPWESEARGKAHVHVVIIGFGLGDTPHKYIFDNDRGTRYSSVSSVKNISPYLIEGNDVLVYKRMHPLSSVPEMDFGSKAADFGHLVLSEEERSDLISKYPFTESWIRPFLGSEEFINGRIRFCLWLKNVSPSELRQCPVVLERMELCRSERAKSVDANTRRWSAFPSLFQADRQPDTDYLVVPKVSSERRLYVPLGFMSPYYITNPSILVVPNAKIYHFGVLSSYMHMAWMRQVCGRLESRYQYSNTIVYNNFPWPESPTDKQRGMVETLAQAVLDVRAKYPLSTLADLYDPLTMPPDLVKAHAALDRAVDQCYRPQPFTTDRQRVEFLFALYERLAAPLLPETKKTGRRK